MNTTTSIDREIKPGTDVTARSVEGIYAAPGLHWVGDGFRVAGFFSSIPEAVHKLDPFLLLDYHPPYEYAASQRPRGVGVHPHRGFETVTFAWEGSVEHHDSAGGGGIIGPGDVQWMTAASGVLHKEYHEREFSRRGGTFHMAQLWVNLPKSSKMAEPRYQPLLASQMGRVELPNGAGTVRVIAGEYAGVKGPALTFSKMDVFDITLRRGAALDLEFPAHHNLGVLLMEGELAVRDGAKASTNSFLVFNNDGARATVEATSDAHLLVLSGEPINEPIVQHGPFVMNTQQEIAQAFADLNRGKFGHLED
jgi:quercetin 2,3-dioxygenase